MQSHIEDTRLTIVKCLFHQAIIDDVFDALDRLTSSIRQVTDRTQLIDDNYEALAKVKFELATLINAQPKVHKTKLLQQRNVLFGSLLRDSIDIVNERRKVTKLCTEFLKGITYFADEPTYSSNHPMYHRAASCSQHGTPNKQCAMTNTRVTKKERSKAIKKCLIERLVYDQLWQNCMSCQQDIRHVTWLGDTLKAYQTCYPGQTIEIEISNHAKDPLEMTMLTTNEDDVPVTLTITVKRDNLITKTYTYVKKYDATNARYLDNVTCIKKKGSNVFVKDTTFQDRSVWTGGASATPQRM